MFETLCERCNQAEYSWHGPIRTRYEPRSQAKSAFRGNSKATHAVTGFCCSRCVMNLLKRRSER